MAHSNGMRCFLAVLVLAGLAGGCARDRQLELEPIGGKFAPRPPAFVSGAMGVLLTNTAGFVAQVEMKQGAGLGDEEPVTGALLGRGTRLLFAPQSDKKIDKKSPPPGFSFIWDVAEHRGWLLSEALQGYAPVSARAVLTNMTAGAAVSSARQVQGHVCQQQLVTFELSNGVTNDYQVLRATDLKGFPVEIVSTQGSTPLVITLSQIQFEVPPENLFAPPDSFAKYDSPEAMVDELAMRQRLLRRR